ncbi:hypothetical protein CEXT_761761 [Caerostris extrusa]|uniref:Uncharacterized protein n=1 Tax=Caerostris extrusa TaxID=172846 RepID=A0AAV4NB50_CAEEX|nr:hypothetical protein CEXT_761761 [Caerostris extrusa]
MDCESGHLVWIVRGHLVWIVGEWVSGMDLPKWGGCVWIVKMASGMNCESGQSGMDCESGIWYGLWKWVSDMDCESGHLV